MPVPSSISDLSTTPSLNSPAGTESPSTVDDYLRTQAAFIRQVDDKATGTVKAADLAATGGSAMVGYDGGTAQDVLDGAKPMANYTALRNYTGRATGVRITQSGLAGFFQRDDADTTSADNGGTVIVDAAGRRWKRLFTGSVNVKWFGAKGNDSDDDTAAILLAKAYVAANLPCVLEIPKGVYRYTNIGNWAYSDFTMLGDSEGGSILKCVDASAGHVGLKLWAFESGSPTAQFIERCNVKNIVVEGNSNTLYGVQMYGLARCNWENVTVVNGKSTSGGVGFQINACMINTFSNLMCSTNYRPMSSVPYCGMLITNGNRGGADVGSSTNNVFINNIMEGPVVGLSLQLADQNTFIGGTSESCTSVGVELAASARNNTFIGHAPESNPNYDINDEGNSSRFINCYSLGTVRLAGRGGKIDGGLYQKITLAGTKNTAENLIVNYVGGGSGGFEDTGTANEWNNLYDQQAGAFTYPLKARVGVVATGSPFTWTNTTGQYVSFVLQAVSGGSLTSVSMGRGGAGYLAPVATPGQWLVAPSDTITFTYTGTPSFSYLPHNGFQG